MWPSESQEKLSPAAWSNLTLHLEDSLIGALTHFLDSWRRNVTAAEAAAAEQSAEENVRDAVVYLAVVIGMFAFIIVAMLVSTVKSKRQEHSNDPYHQYIKEGWTAQMEQGDAFSNFAAR